MPAEQAGAAAFRHVLLTRFNVTVDGTRPLPDDRWMHERFVLFERHCLPSVLSQTCQDFRWLVFFDAGTEPRWRRRAEHLAAQTGRFLPVYLDGAFAAARAAEAITSQGLGDRPYLMTSRLDNDDALAPHYVESVQRAFRPRALEFLNFPLGYQLADGRVYLRPYLASSFVSLVERRRGGLPRTVHFTEHHLVGAHPVRQLWTRPSWLQVVHGGNLANEVRGIPIRPDGARRRFRLQEVEPGGPSVRERAGAVARFAARGLSSAEARQRAVGALRPGRRAPAADPITPPDATGGALRITALVTCHDRRDLTLAALAGWFGQEGHGAELGAVLVDDGSTDGTADAVGRAFPQVEVVRADGTLFWAAGMALAETHALRHRPDAVLWLNDDVSLAPDCLTRLLAVSAQYRPAAVVAGAVADPDSGEPSYGAFEPGRWHPLRGRLLAPTGVPRPAGPVHGNVLLVPREAYLATRIDGRFEHAYADFDYGLRLRRRGYPVVLSPSAVGWCSRGSSSRTGPPAGLPLGARLAALRSPHGLPLRSHIRFMRRHGGILWPAWVLSPYLREVLRTPAVVARGSGRRR